MHIINRVRSAVLCAAMVATLITVSGADANPAGQRSATGKAGVTNVTIAVAAYAASYSLVQIAKDHNLFPPNVNVTWTLLPGATLIAPVGTGAIPFAISANPGLDIGVASSGVPVKWLAQWQDPSDFEMIVRPGISSLADLKGKKIGITTPGATVAILANVVLNTAKLGEGDFTLVSLGTASNMVAAFIGNRIDAMVQSSTSAQPPLAAVPGSKILYNFYTQKFAWSAAGIAGYMPWVTAHPGITTGILNGLNKALILLHSNPAVAKAAIAKFSSITDQSILNTQYTAANARTQPHLEPMSLATEQNVLKVLRVNGFPEAKASLAPSLISSTYVNRVIAPKTKKTKK